MSNTSRRTWIAPKLTVHGSIAEVTQQVVKPKRLGFKDDFNVPGISDP